MRRIGFETEALCYDDRGTGSEIVVNLHGGFFGRHDFQQVTPLLVDRYRCITPQLRGFTSDGEVQDATEYLDVWIEDIVALFDALSIERAHIHGTSTGGTVAMELAAQYSERVSGLVLSGVVGRGDETTAIFASTWMKLAAADPTGPGVGDLMSFFCFSRPYLEQLSAVRGLVEFLDLSLPEAFRRPELTAPLLMHDARPAATLIRTPTLILSGACDLIAPAVLGPSGCGSTELATLIAGAKCVELAAGHAMLLEAPDAAAQAILAFLGASAL